MSSRIPLAHGHDDLHIRFAREGDLNGILRLRKHLARWLSKKGLDQWQKPWPDKDEQTRRILAAIRARSTWMVCEGKKPVATMTLHEADHGRLWTDVEEGAGSALYVSRMMVHRDYAGRGVGAAMLDWAESYATALGLDRIRLDAWTANHALHAYYKEQGFDHVGWVPERALLNRPDLEDYPSTALFQRRVRPVDHRSYSRHDDEKVSFGSRVVKKVNRTTRSA